MTVAEADQLAVRIGVRLNGRTLLVSPALVTVAWVGRGTAVKERSQRSGERPGKLGFHRGRSCVGIRFATPMRKRKPREVQTVYSTSSCFEPAVAESSTACKSEDRLADL